MTDGKKWGVPQLKNALTLFNLEKTGTRAEMIRRLFDYFMEPKELHRKATKKRTISAVLKKEEKAPVETKKVRKEKRKKGDRPKRFLTGYVMFTVSINNNDNDYCYCYYYYCCRNCRSCFLYEFMYSYLYWLYFISRMQHDQLSKNKIQGQLLKKSARF